MIPLKPGDFTDGSLVTTTSEGAKKGVFKGQFKSPEPQQWPVKQLS